MKKNVSRLIDAIEGGDLNSTVTWNGAPAYLSTLDSNLDWFGGIGSTRGNAEKSLRLFSDAFRDDPLLATRILFYGRDIRGGQGERQTFRDCLRWLADQHPEVLRKNIELVPEYGRWDDLYALVGTVLERESLSLLVAQLNKDYWNLQKGESISLAAKWVKSLNTSSKESRRLAEKTRIAWCVSERTYRKTLSTLRNAIRVVEQKMSAGNWDKIDYKSVPSRCMHLSNKAFQRHDPDGFAKYMEDLKSGKTKINSSALFPYDLVSKYDAYTTQKDYVIEEQWKALPNYLKGNEHNGLVMCDVSGSMLSSYHSTVRPIDVSVSLAIYIAERNTGYFKDAFLTFTDTPTLVRISDCESLLSKVKRCHRHEGFNTDIQKAFDTVLRRALRKNVPQEEMPEVIYVISDMQFDSPYVGGNKTNFEVIRDKYEGSGYRLPKLVFWNVNSADNVPIKKGDGNTALVSGCNPTIFKQILSGSTPVEVMLEVVNSPRYEAIKV